MIQFYYFHRIIAFYSLIKRSFFKELLKKKAEGGEKRVEKVEGKKEGERGEEVIIIWGIYLLMQCIWKLTAWLFDL